MMERNTWPDALACLIQIARKDPVIKHRLINVLQLNSFERRSVLIIWLEQLRLRNSSKDLLDALSCLFDDKIAEKVLTLINEGEFKRR
jgi:hypothetical protein